VDLIRGLDASKAVSQLKFLTKRSAGPVLKLLNSATANALKNQGLTEENLYISDIKVDSGPSLKRWRARAMGRAAAILKRTSHITLTLKEKDSSMVKPQGGKPQRSEPIQEKISVQSEEGPKRPTSKVVEKIIAENKPLPRGKSVAPKRPYQEDSQSKKKFFSRQTFGNAKKIFRRKSI